MVLGMMLSSSLSFSGAGAGNSLIDISVSSHCNYQEQLKVG